MRKFILIVISLLFCFSLKASELFINEKVDSVLINAPLRLFICQGDTTAIRFRADVVIKNYVTYSVKNGVLSVKVDPELIKEVQERGLVLYIMTPKGSDLLVNVGRGYTKVNLGGNHDKK